MGDSKNCRGTAPACRAIALATEGALFFLFPKVSEIIKYPRYAPHCLGFLIPSISLYLVLHIMQLAKSSIKLHQILMSP